MDIARPGPGEGSLPPRARLRTDAPSQSLDGTWEFRLWPSLAAALEGIAPPAPDAGAGPRDTPTAPWHPIEVPGHWNLQGHGKPAYSNVPLPFPLDPPHPPDANPIGDYRLTFTPDPAVAAHRVWLRTEGIESAAELWLNGTRLGTTRGSRLTHEFDATAALVPGPNTLLIRVAQFSDATYLEDQDMWWLPGIFRSVTLLARPNGGIDDARVTADFDPATGRGWVAAGALVDGGGTATLTIAELGVTIPAGGGPVDVGPVSPWSAEAPRLYDATLTTPTETVTLRLGFRRIETAGGVLTLNGAPIMLRGVNRHEHRPRHGRVHDAATARAELELMKRHHINAIRTSHYPPHSDVLDLADELGLYVVLENDLETHAFVMVDWRGNPSDDPRWESAYLDRIARTWHRDKNHASVIMWSLGNEAGAGVNLAAMAAWLRDADATRPTHYEGDRASTYVDVYSRMYPSHEEVRAIGEGAEHPHLPFLLCEFAHAMGNGPGGVAEYWELVERYPRHAGGFVWEWVEHGIEADVGILYGGDFGEAVHDGNFCIDGLVSAHREPRPGLIDYAAIIAPVRVGVAGGRSTVTVANRYDVLDLAHVALAWERRVDGEVVASGPLAVPPVPPRSSATVPLPAEASAPLPRDPREADVLTVTASVVAPAPWAPAGHLVGVGQDVAAGRVPVPAAAAPTTTPRAAPTASPRAGGVDLADASRAVRLGGIEFAAPAVGLWRAPTDNDRWRGWDEPDQPSFAERWHEAGIDRVATRVVSVAEAPGGGVTVTLRAGVVVKDSFIDAVLTWTPVEAAIGGVAGAGSADAGAAGAVGSSVRLDATLTPSGNWDVPWARVGLDLVIPAPPLGLDFAGLGPGASYPDSGNGVTWGWWSVPAGELTVPHVRPQESGARRGTRRADVHTGAGTLRVETLGEPFAITVAASPRSAIAAAAHAHELMPDGSTHVSIDAFQSGVGTAACGPGVLPQHRLQARPATFSLLLTAVSR